MPPRRKTRPPPEKGNGDSLSRYRAKRAFDQTPEPGGLVPKPAPKPGGLLIVHMHDATRLHWDLRLEMDGVLRSWAVPKGPSANPADKAQCRLAAARACVFIGTARAGDSLPVNCHDERFEAADRLRAILGQRR